MSEAEIQQLAEMLQRARRVVVFTGAGISTESGIPDFRSPGGLWTKYRPIEFQDFMASEEMRREAWRRKFAMDDTMEQAQPNRGHRAVAALAAEPTARSRVDGALRVVAVVELDVVAADLVHRPVEALQRGLDVLAKRLAAEAVAPDLHVGHEQVEPGVDVARVDRERVADRELADLLQRLDAFETLLERCHGSVLLRQPEVLLEARRVASLPRVRGRIVPRRWNRRCDCR